MSRVKALFFAVLAFIALSSEPVSANNVQPCDPYLGCPVALTFSGTVTSGLDNLGLFGTPGADLTGHGATFLFVTGPHNTGPHLFSGEIGTATIGDHSTRVPNVDGGSFYLSPGSVVASVFAVDCPPDPAYPCVTYDLAASVVGGVVIPPEDLFTNASNADYLTRSFAYDLQPSDSGTASVDVIRILLGPPCSPFPACATTEDRIQVDINRVTLDAASAAVSEPATLLLLGCGLAGLACLAWSKNAVWKS